MTEDEFKMNRRKFGASVVSALTAGAAGCNESSDNTTETVETTQERNTPTETATEQPTATPEEEMSEEDIEQALEATAYNLHDDLYMRGFEPDDYKLVDVSDSLNEDTEYQLRVEVDLNSVFHTQGMVARDQDLHTAGELGLADDIFKDVRPQLHELADMVSENLNHFYDEVGGEEEVPLSLDIKVSGDRDSSYAFGINTAEQELDPTLEKFIRQPDSMGSHTYSPMEYENQTLLREGEVRTFEFGNEEHTLEYLDNGAFRINGNLEERGEREKLGRFNGEDVYVEEIDPIYLQERGEAEGAVELEFDSMEPEY